MMCEAAPLQDWSWTSVDWHNCPVCVLILVKQSHSKVHHNDEELCCG